MKSSTDVFLPMPDPSVQHSDQKGWLAIAKLKPLSLFLSILLMLKKAFDIAKIDKRKVKVVLA